MYINVVVVVRRDFAIEALLTPKSGKAADGGREYIVNSPTKDQQEVFASA